MSAVLDFFVKNLENIALVVSIVAAVVGLTALVAVTFFWSYVSPHYKEAWAKGAVAGFRAIAALLAIATRLAPTDLSKPFLDQPWALTTLVAVIGYLLWEITGVVGDHRYKSAKEETAADYQAQIDEANQDCADAEYQSMRLGWLLTHLRQLVNDKRQRVRGITQALGDRVTIQHARDGLAPYQQVQILLECLASLFRMQAVHQDGSRHNQNFRVGLFAEREGRLVPLAAFDLSTRSHEPFSSYDRHADRFRLDATAPSHAVRCIREGQMLIVPDCTAVPGFFFHDGQAAYLRSLVACPIANFCPDGVTPARAALLIDTDVAGFFQEDDREMLEILLTQFVARIDLEYTIGGLTG